jgi:hypothetical protein
MHVISVSPGIPALLNIGLVFLCFIFAVSIGLGRELQLKVGLSGTVCHISVFLQHRVT